MWRDIKARLHELVDNRQVTPVWGVDEAQNLPPEFFRDFPSFLNFAFDSRDLLSVWLVGHPAVAQTLDRAPYAALHSRIQVRFGLKPIAERERFHLLITHALKSAGCQHTLLADSGRSARRPRACLGWLGASCAPPCAWPCKRRSTTCPTRLFSRPSRSCNELALRPDAHRRTRR